MNRRNNTARSWCPHRLFGPRGNRRVRQTPRADCQEARPAAAVDSAEGGVRRSASRFFARALRLLIFAAKVTAVGVLLLAVAFGGYYTYNRVVASDYFHVRQIEVVSTRRASTEEIAALLEGAKGKNLLALDLPALRRVALGHPWVREARLERRLPGTLRVRVTEHRARALLLMGHIYLVNQDGQVFKRARPDEQEGMPVITGVSRMAYLEDPDRERERIKRALVTLDRYYSRARPPLSEVHLGERGELSLYLQRGGVAVRVGMELTKERLAKMDAVWAALGPEARQARVLFLDNVARTDRVTVRMGSY